MKLNVYLKLVFYFSPFVLELQSAFVYVTYVCLLVSYFFIVYGINDDTVMVLVVP